MKSPQELLKLLKRLPTDVVGLDVSPGGVAVARMRKHNAEAYQVTGVDILPLPEPLEAEDLEDQDSEEPHVPLPRPLELPVRLRGKYASLAMPDSGCTIRLLSFPGRPDEDLDTRIVEALALEDPEHYRISFRLVNEGSARTETRVIAVAMPEDHAVTGLALLPGAGIPAPHSIEISSLATMTAFLHSAHGQPEGETAGVIVFGAASSLFVIFRNRVPALVRHIDRGSDALLAAVEQSLGVDRATAEGIMSDGSFDISHAVTEVLDPMIRQFIVSRDFVERRENCRVSTIFVSGGMVVSRDAREAIRSAMGADVQTWNPLDGLDVAPDAVLESVQGQEWRLAAAIGACQATLEAS